MRTLPDNCALLRTAAEWRGKTVREKSRKITVLMDASDFERFESFCDSRGYKKSTLIARLIREHLKGETFLSQRNLPFGTEPDRAYNDDQ